MDSIEKVVSGANRLKFKDSEIFNIPDIEKEKIEKAEKQLTSNNIKFQFASYYTEYGLKYGYIKTEKDGSKYFCSFH